MRRQAATWSCRQSSAYVCLNGSEGAFIDLGLCDSGFTSDELKVTEEAMDSLREAHNEELRQREAQSGLLQEEHQRQLEECKDAILRGRLEAEGNAAAAAEREGALMMQIEEVKVMIMGRGAITYQRMYLTVFIRPRKLLEHVCLLPCFSQSQLLGTQGQVDRAVFAIEQYRERQAVLEEELEAVRRQYEASLERIEMERKRDDRM